MTLSRNLAVYLFAPLVACSGAKSQIDPAELFPEGYRDFKLGMSITEVANQLGQHKHKSRYLQVRRDDMSSAVDSTELPLDSAALVAKVHELVDPVLAQADAAKKPIFWTINVEEDPSSPFDGGVPRRRG